MSSDLRFDIFPDALGAALAIARGGRLVALGHHATPGEAEEVLGRNWPEAERDPSAWPLPELKRQLAEYLTGERRDFDLPLAPEGTEFQCRVWQALTTIPYGETRSYVDIARAVGSPGASRAVGGANHDNPIGIVIPCHRVIGADGSLTGYAGGVERKRRLLELEGALTSSLSFRS